MPGRRNPTAAARRPRLNRALRTLRVAGKSLALTGIIAMAAPAQALVLAATRRRAAMRLPRLTHQLLCRALGIRVEVQGVPATGGQVVYLGNHLSHLDVSVLGSVLDASFVAKDDVRDWPLIGWLCGLQQTVFVSRNPRRAAEVSAALSSALSSGRQLVIFPEGTTSDGSAVLPFKSSLFGVLADPAHRHVVVQPVTIELLEVDGRRVGQGGNRDLYAYYGEMRLLPHLAAFMRCSGACLRLTFHSPLPASGSMPRKQLASTAYAKVAQGGDAWATERREQAT